MFVIQQINTEPYQRSTLILPDGTKTTFILRFVPMQYGWFIESLTYGSFVLNGFRVSNSPNMLHQYRNQIPFGIACFSTANREPSQQQDFDSGSSILYLLDSTDVKSFTRYLLGIA